MLRERVLDVLKSATEVNLRYSAITLKLAREYIKEFDGVVRDGVARKAEPVEPEAAAPPAQRPPILLVGRAGAEATGAFMLSNGADADLPVSLLVQGELGPVRAELEPASLVIAPGGNAIVQLRVAIVEAMEPGRDYAGAVVAPGLSAQAVEFVARRLPDEAPAKPAPTVKTSRRRAG
ncbi:MAG TPA: hypothetical protein VFZ91_15230 [Allosphingosinicella sp.]